eukprot:6480917-Amphidinium_carterae.2
MQHRCSRARETRQSGRRRSRVVNCAPISSLQRGTRSRFIALRRPFAAKSSRVVLRAASAVVEAKVEGLHLLSSPLV